MVINQEPASPQRSALPDVAVKHDRRRPGRVEVDPALIPLLRGTAPFIEPLQVGPPQVGSPQIELAPHQYTKQGSFDFDAGSDLEKQAWLDNLDDGGNPGRAVVIGSLLSLPCWFVALAICYWFVG